MNCINSWFQTSLLRQVLTIVVVGFLFFATPVFNSNMLLASADTVKSPEGIYYKGAPQGSSNKGLNNKDDKSVFDASEATQNKGEEKTENPFKEAVDNVREKLNLDEKLPRSTKEFLKETEEKVEETVEPVTGTRKGYYQIP